jgi:nitroreductase
MALLNQLRDRASAKAFDGKPLPQEILEQILEATSYSPRAGNLQHFAIRVITKKTELQRMSQIFFDCETTANASALLIFFVDLHTTAEYFKSEDVNYPFANLMGYHYALADATIAMQTASLVAENLGVATRVLAASLMRAKALDTAFVAPAGTTAAFSLALGFESKPEAANRHNLPWETYTAQGMDSAWPNWKTVYVESGKARQEVGVLEAMDRVGAKMERDSTLNTAAKVLARVKYKVEELERFSTELGEHLRKLFK